jgi:hypothetical protein
MIDREKYFRKNNIQTFIDHGGCSAKTLDAMEYVGNIFDHLPRRGSMTSQERMASEHCDRLMLNRLRQKEMERNRQPNVIEVTEPDVD